ncbi:MAG: Rpn family recombination-promoting nuclease/putative transposase [Agathobacter sp.]|nr:Rpn family recombination-promoting nuclease/putative transposase [Agathobacter sp.]
MNTEMMNAVKAADDKAQYDIRAKRLLAQKSILAHILVKTVDEFKGMKPEEVVTYIEGDPKVGIVPVEPGLTNAEQIEDSGQRIKGLNTEDAEINEGMIRFDIIFYVRMKDGLSQIIINIEAQKDEPVAYKILNRAIFYVSRLVSSQKERDFVNSNYDDIKQVFSIWICMNMDCNSMSHIHLTKDEMLEPYEWKGNIDLLNIVLIGIRNDLPEHNEKYELHRLIGALLSDELQEKEKLSIIENEYSIPLSDDLRKDVSIMCNLSQGIVDKTKAEIIVNMYKKGFTPDQIADAVEVSLAEVEANIKKKEASVYNK